VSTRGSNIAGEWLGERFSGGKESEYCSGSVVEFAGDGVEVGHVVRPGLRGSPWCQRAASAKRVRPAAMVRVGCGVVMAGVPVDLSDGCRAALGQHANVGTWRRGSGARSATLTRSAAIAVCTPQPRSAFRACSSNFRPVCPIVCLGQDVSRAGSPGCARHSAW
jgi:hypothetical protein